MKLLIDLLMRFGLADYVARQLHRPNGFFGSRFIGKMMNRGNAHLELTAITCANINPNETVLEIGFGNGKMLEELCRLASDGKVHGADISDDLINQVSKRLRAELKSEKLLLHLAGVSQLPLDDNSIDCIITCNTIYFWPNPLADAKELYRVLKPNGRLVCGYRTVDEMENFEFVQRNTDIFKNRLTDSEVEQLLNAAGFDRLEIRVEPSDLAPSHIAIACK